MSRKLKEGKSAPAAALAGFACPNPDCSKFNCFGAGNLSVAEWTGKNKGIRRLYCHMCGQRFSERRGTLMDGTKLPHEAVVRIVKCLGHGCSIEATADICEVDARTVEKFLAKAGRRAEDFHNLQLDKIKEVDAVQLDELHGRVSPTPAKKGGPEASLLQRVAAWVVSGFTRRWP